MSTVVQSTDAGTQRTTGMGLVHALLNGAGQVMFQENPLTGLLFLIGIFVASVQLGIAGLLGLVASTVTALVMRVPFATVRQGLYGFNGILVGIALAVFLQFDGWLIAYIMIGGAAAAVLSATCSAVLDKYELPFTTAPFVVATWMLLLGAFVLARFEPAALSSPALPVLPPLATAWPDAAATGQGVLTGVSQVMLIANVITGLLFLAGIAVNSIRAAVLALVGSILGIAVGAVFGGPTDWVAQGLFGFSPVLTAIALGCVFLQPGPRAYIVGALGAVLTAVVGAAMVPLLQPIGLPTLTMPYILTLWVILLAVRALRREA